MGLFSRAKEPKQKRSLAERAADLERGIGERDRALTERVAEDMGQAVEKRLAARDIDRDGVEFAWLVQQKDCSDVVLLIRRGLLELHRGLSAAPVKVALSRVAAVEVGKRGVVSSEVAVTGSGVDLRFKAAGATRVQDEILSRLT